MTIQYRSRSQIQDELADTCLSNDKNNVDSLIIAPTGFGKTNTFNKIAIDLSKSDKKTLIVQDRIKISKQNGENAINQGASKVSICFDGNFDQSGQLVFGVSNTIYDNLNELEKYDVVIIDECHHMADKENSRHGDILNALLEKNPELTVMAFTAHDSRHDKLKLHPRIDKADRHVVTQKEAEMCGAIVKTDTKVPEIRLKTFETIEEATDRFIDPLNTGERRTGLQKYIQDNLPEDYHEKCVKLWASNVHVSAKSTFAFADDVKECKLATEEFLKRGVKAEEIHYKIPAEEIEARFRRYRNGETTVLVSVDMLTEGVNEPITANVLNMKKTTTLEEWVQMNGRCRRAYEQRTQGNVIDCGASSFLHGTMEKNSEIEAYALLGKNSTKWRPWNLVSGKLETDKQSAEYPQVYAINNGKETLFAIKSKGSREKFKIIIKQEVSLGSKKQENVKNLKRIPLEYDIQQLQEIGRESVSDNIAIYTILASRTKEKSIKNVLTASYQESKDSINIILRNDAKKKSDVGMSI